MRSSLIPLAENELNFFAIRERLIPFIRIILRRFLLDGYYQPDDVLNECFLRLKSKKPIKNIPNTEAWLRVTAYHIIREYSRKRKRETLIPNEMYEEIPDLNSNSYVESLEEYEHLREEYEHLREAFLQLPTDKQELLSLHLVRGLSWNEIADFYRERGEEVSAATLRKRHQRVLNVLRELVLAKL